MIEVVNVHKTMDDKKILQDISFAIPNGSIVGLLGRNGAGKTTLLRILAGIITPEVGKVFFASHDIATHPEIKRKIAYVPDAPVFLINIE